jgi:hypothetical protein
MRLPDTDPSKETLVLFAQTQEIKQELTNLKNLITGWAVLLILLILILKYYG